MRPFAYECRAAGFCLALLVLWCAWPGAPGLQAAEEEASRTVVIVGEESPPFECTDADGAPRGIIVDIWKLWGKRAGVTVEYRILPWTEALSSVQQGEADIVAGMFRTPEREALWDFSAPYYSYDAAVFFHEDLGGVRGIEDLKGFRVGLMEGDASLDLLRTTHEETEFITYPTWEALIRAALADEVRVFVADVPQARHYLAKFSGEEAHGIVQAADPLRTGRLHGGVRKGNAELVALINRGFDRITSDELDAITARWTGLRLAQSAPVPWRSIALVGLGLVLLLVLVHATLLRIQVQRRTRELIASRETLRETSRLLATVFNAIPDPIGVIDREYNLVRVNRAGEAFTHQFPTSDSGLCCYQKLGRNTPCEPCPTREAFETGTTALCEKHEPATGAWFEVRAYPLLDADGHVIRVVEHLRDVTEARRSREELKEAHASLEQTVADRTRELEATNRQLQAEVEERRRTEEQLRRERRLFHDLVMLNPYAILVTDVDGHVKLSNPRIESLIGRPIETPRETYSIFADPQIVEAGIADRIRALGAGECLYLPEYRYDFGRLNPASSGESQRLCLRSVVFPVHDADGVLQNYVVMHEDITESKELQEQLIQSERMAAVGTLAGGVAHEFNNINTTVLGFAQLLLAELPDEAPEREHLSRIAKAARRAADITRNLLTFAGGGGGRGERRDVLLETILEETLHLVEDKFRADGVVFERAYEATPIIHADPAQIGQVVLNLLINARHALLDRPDKRIRLAIQSTDGTATLKVIDNGIGISEDNLRLIFTPFFSTKGEHSTRGHPEAVHRGAGLGLSVSRTIAESHGGHLSAESREGAGSTFRLTLPLGTGDDDAQQHPAPRPERDWGRLAALVVEDESDITELVRLCLRRAGCRVETSDDGAVALRRLEEERFDLLALDLHMPRMHGQEILDSMAGLPADRRPACLVMTGRQEDTDEAACRAAGAHAFLRKPFDEPAFLDAADEALRARG